MSNITIRVSLPGYDALTDTNPDHYALYADEDWILIKEFARGTGSVSLSDPNPDEITHNLGYVPMYLVYAEIASGTYSLINSHMNASKYFLFGGYKWFINADNTKLYIDNRYSDTYVNYRYYIFYDQMA